MVHSNSLNEEDLLSLAESKDEVEEFIAILGIKTGDAKVTASIIYRAYKKWRGRKQEKLAKIVFFTKFSNYFQGKRSNDVRYYLLDPSPFDLSEYNYWRTRREVRGEKRRKKNKKKTSKSN